MDKNTNTDREFLRMKLKARIHGDKIKRMTKNNREHETLKLESQAREALEKSGTGKTLDQVWNEQFKAQLQ